MTLTPQKDNIVKKPRDYNKKTTINAGNFALKAINFSHIKKKRPDKQSRTPFETISEGLTF
jgi:hypothetical protein